MAQAPTDARPNVIFLYADDLGYGDLGCYGCPDIDTPNMDQLADEGIRFTDGYAASPVCSPSRAAFVTGRYPQRLGPHCEGYMGAGNPGLDPSEHPSIATYLDDAGYRTASIGKWNVGGEPDYTPGDHDFDYWLGFHHNFNYFTHSQYWYQGGELKDGPPMLYENGEIVDRDGYITNVLADQTITFIEESVDNDEPFFAYVPWQAPHAPMQSPTDDPEIPPEYGGPEWDRDRDTYVEIVEHLDTQIGRILDCIAEEGIEEETLVIMSSDNGGHRAARNSPLTGFKQDLYEGGIRVPFVMRWPGVIPAGSETAQPAITMDITATIAAVTDASIPQEHAMDGIDLIPYCTGERDPDEDRTLFWRRRTLLGREDNLIRARAIRDDGWKYFRDRDPVGPPDIPEGTFHLVDDITESTNLIDDKPQVTQKLKQQLADWERAVVPDESQAGED